MQQLDVGVCVGSYQYRQLHKVGDLQVFRVHCWPRLLQDVSSLPEKPAEGVLHLTKTCWETRDDRREKYIKDICFYTQEMLYCAEALSNSHHTNSEEK